MAIGTSTPATTVVGGAPIGGAAVRHADHRRMAVADRPEAVARARRGLAHERRAGGEQVPIQGEAAHQRAINRQPNVQGALLRAGGRPPRGDRVRPTVAPASCAGNARSPPDNARRTGTPWVRIDRASLEKKGERGVLTIDAKFLHYKEY